MGTWAAAHQQITGNIHYSWWKSHFVGCFPSTEGTLCLILLNQSSLSSVPQVGQDLLYRFKCLEPNKVFKWAFYTFLFPALKCSKTAVFHLIYCIYFKPSVDITLTKHQTGSACVRMASESEDQCRVCLNMFVQHAVMTHSLWECVHVSVLFMCVSQLQKLTAQCIWSLLSCIIICSINTH